MINTILDVQIEEAARRRAEREREQLEQEAKNLRAENKQLREALEGIECQCKWMATKNKRIFTCLRCEALEASDE